LGSFGGVRSPLTPPTEVTLLDISLDSGAELELPLAAGQQAFVMPIFGSTEVNGKSFGLDDLSVPILPAATEAMTHKLSRQARRSQGRSVHRQTTAPARAFERAYGLCEPGESDGGNRRLSPGRLRKPVTSRHTAWAYAHAPFTTKEVHHGI